LNPRITVSSANKDDDYNLDIEDDMPILNNMQDKLILSKKGAISKASPDDRGKHLYNNDDDEPLDNDKIIIELQSNLSEESKRRGDSLKSNISKDTIVSFSNPILNLLEKANNVNVDKVIKNLKVNVYALKTALMCPIDIYVDNNEDCTVSPETYLKYSDYDECFGLFLVIKNQNSKAFKYLWEERGTLW
jgi:hypothetical protein